MPPVAAVPAAPAAPKPPGGVESPATPAPAPRPAQEATKLEATKQTAQKPARSKAQNKTPKCLLMWALVGVVVLGVGVWASRSFLGSDAGQSFLEAYPGPAPMPENAPVGIPAWLNWAHFFNMFLMVLIIRTGLQVRGQRKPEAYWRPKKGGKKISLVLWFHLVLDVLWVLNGVIFVVLLFATGQWMRIVPTSWDVFPNAVSAGLQYLSLDWPTENGWVYYNALQQLAYFVTVFIAAPLAIASGARMSMWWRNEWKTANKLFPAPVARAVHFPVLVYFLVFVVVHVGLVLTTGVLRNLNTMYAARGAVDPNEYAADWTGLIMFLVSLVVVAAAVAVARPQFLAPVARLTGEVSTR